MAIIFNNLEEKSDLQRRISSELREKIEKKSNEPKDLVGPEYDIENSEYTKNMKQTSSLAWAWALIAVAFIGIIIAVIIITNN